MVKRTLSITLHLCDGRIILTKLRKRMLSCGGPYDKWAVSVEYPLFYSVSPLDMFNTLMWDIFGIDTLSYSDNFVEMQRLSAIEDKCCGKIYPFIVKMKSAFALQGDTDDEFKALFWKNIVDDILTKTMYKPTGTEKVHSDIAVVITKEMQRRGLHA